MCNSEMQITERKKNKSMTYCDTFTEKGLSLQHKLKHSLNRNYPYNAIKSQLYFFPALEQMCFLVHTIHFCRKI